MVIMSEAANGSGSDRVCVPHEQLARSVAELFRHVGLAEDDARLYAESLVETDLRGVYSHGVIRTPFYIRRLQEGGDNPRPKFRIERETVATAVLDGDYGPGHLVANRAMQIAIEKARDAGIGVVSAVNSGHFGAAALWAMQPLPSDMIGIATTNGPPVMVPWSGRQAAMANNPIAIAVPARRHLPLVFDGAMSKVAGGKVRLAAKKGEPVPDDWIVDSRGRPSTDPNDLPNGGALLPLGYKGYGLAVMMEVLAGILPGGMILDEMPVWFAFPRDRTRVGHLFQAIRIDAFSELDRFKSRVDELIDRLKAVQIAEGESEILVPGEPEHRRAEVQRRDGIELPRPVVEDLQKLARDFGTLPPLQG
jgi:LDH2 family malate/lactate/ureidoglycolate dehydrogenase